jgi:hypothetical protein
MSKINCRILGLFAACLCSIAHAGVLHVPADFATIQSAINTSTNGDVVLVNPGVYNENINFKGKAITVTGTNVADFNVVKSTVIHAVGNASAVTFATGETTNSVLAGLTITGGYGTVNATFGTNIVWGAGIYCVTSSPSILGNLIATNITPDGSTGLYEYGCAIGCVQSDPIIVGNIITANSGYAGGGILTYLGHAKIANNLIYSNAAVVGGGAVMISGGQCINNTFSGNAASGGGGNFYASSDVTGQCLITNNIICNATNGGGVYVDDADTFTQFAYNDVWNNTGNDYYSSTNRTGINGNISQDPLFVNAASNDYHLQDSSPCINAGDPNFQPLNGELDFYRNPRLYAKRIDIGAAEYSDNFRPLADAGPDQILVVTNLPAIVTLDGGASSDPNNAPLSWHWTQLSGPSVTLSDTNAATPTFTAPALTTYLFKLVVNNGTNDSFSDTVQVTVKNDPPIADAGDNQFYSDQTPVPSITLDGSRSSDPEHVTLTYHWTQLSGWTVQLSDASAMKPTFANPWPGTYLFQLIVNDGLHDSQPAIVKIVIGPNHAPVAQPGPARYLVAGSVVLDGTKSYDPDGSPLTYEWRQTSGPAATITGTNTATPTVTVTAKTAVTKCVFQLVVSDGLLTSALTNVTVTIVPNFGSNVLTLSAPFDAAKPTIVAFGGGNCSSGSGMTFGGPWDQQANWITVNTYTSTYSKYGDMLVALLSGLAPDYKKPIQTIGFSTGNLPAMEVARYVNATYADARYAVNRVSLLDAVCSNLGTSVSQFDSKPIAGEQCWVDNYISNDPGHTRQPILAGAFNIVCNPARAHDYPVDRYMTNTLDYTNGGFIAFGYLSLIGTGKNFQLNTASQRYYFTIDSTESLVYFNQTVYPGKIMAPVKLNGPADNTIIATNGAVFSCGTVENASHYQLLFGSDPDRVMDYTVLSDTTNPPTQVISALPYDRTWWTVKAFDQIGSTIYADPRLIQRPANNPPVANAGPDQVVYAGQDGTANVALNGANSSDPDGDALGFAWAWSVDANAYVTNGIAPTISLPVGTYTIQLMVSDAHTNSQPDQVTVTVLPPLPLLSIVLSESNAILSWSTNDSSFQLESTTNLDSTTIWSNVSGTPTIFSNQYIVTDPIDSRKFYRLHNP